MEHDRSSVSDSLSGHSPEHHRVDDAAMWAVDKFDLGALVAPAESVTGGLSNDLWRLETSTGGYSMKHMLANSMRVDFKQNVEDSALIEQLAFRAGIPMPEPLYVPGTENVLVKNPHFPPPGYVRIHRWLDGSTVATESAQPAELHAVGLLLANIHDLPLPSKFDNVSGPSVHEPHEWSGMRQVQPEDVAVLTTLDSIVRDARRVGGQEVVTAHRDMDAKNFLRTQESLVVVDWDAAGIANRQEDVVSTALSWSGIVERDYSEERFAAVVRGYSQSAGISPVIDRHSYAGWIEATLDWIWFNLERGEGGDDVSMLLCEQEVRNNLNACRRLLRLL